MRGGLNRGFTVCYFAEMHHDTEETNEETAKRPFLVEQIDGVLFNVIAVFSTSSI